LALVALCILLASTTAYAATRHFVVLFPQTHIHEEHYTYSVATGESGFKGLTVEIHSSIYQYRWIDGEKYLIYTYHHPAALTSIGENFTAMKMSGHADWPYNDEALYNVTYISVGNGTLTVASTQLSNEWNRTDGTFEYIAVGKWNYSTSFYPSGSGRTNATGLQWKSSGDGNLWAYDTFTAIDYTSNDQIDVEWQVDVSYS